MRVKPRVTHSNRWLHHCKRLQQNYQIIIAVILGWFNIQIIWLCVHNWVRCFYVMRMLSMFAISRTHIINKNNLSSLKLFKQCNKDLQLVVTIQQSISTIKSMRICKCCMWNQSLISSVKLRVSVSHQSVKTQLLWHSQVIWYIVWNLRLNNFWKNNNNLNWSPCHFIHVLQWIQAHIQ